MGFYHFGVCCAYVVFIADNLKELLDFYGYDIDTRFYIFALSLPLSAIYFVRDLRNLVPFNAVADAMICFSIESNFDCDFDAEVMLCRFHHCILLHIHGITFVG